VCESCNYASYRTDVALELIGKVAQVAPIESALALRARGTLDGSGFQVVGQVQLDHGAGPWNEWAIAFDDGASAWLAEAQGQVLLMRAVDAGRGLRYADMRAGAEVDLGPHGRWTIAEKGVGRVTAIRGELPSAIVPEALVRYADLSGADGGFGTLDFGAGEICEAVYLGRRASLVELALDLTGAETRPDRKTKAARITCPKCAGAIDLKDPDNALRVGCPYCGALLDPRSTAMSVLAVSSTMRQRPGLPIGAKGRLIGQDFEVLAWLERSITSEGVRYPWDEYLLRRGDGAYRWLVCSERQWSFVEPLNLADVKRSSSRASFKGRSFRHFSGGRARVDSVLGEVYWEVAVGETVSSDDYIDPPLMLSFESSDGEKLVSLGTYLERGVVKSAFGLAQDLPRPSAIGAIQPNPVRSHLKRWWASAAVITAIVLGLDLFFHAVHAGAVAHSGKYPLVKLARVGDSSPIVSDEFELKGWRGNAEVIVSAPALAQGSLDLEGSLASSSTGATYPFAVRATGSAGLDASSLRRIESATVRVGGVPGGRYRLRLEPHCQLAAPDATFEVVVRRQRASNALPIVIVLLCWAVPILMSLIAVGLESARWQKSDHA
jgi:hypothetical protein